MNHSATRAEATQPRFLMCPPQHFAVAYSINPWMDPKAWTDDGPALQASAAAQWADLHRILLENGAAVETVEPLPHLPDLVFTANAAVVLNGKALLARFRHPERQPEQPIYAQCFRALCLRGLIDEVVEMPHGIPLEGAGDCLWDANRSLFWMGCGYRSDASAAPVIEAEFGTRCLPLALADPRFYHLDTCFSPLPCGALIYYPEAFTRPALETIHTHVAPQQRVALDEADAARFAANVVSFDQVLVFSRVSSRLRRTLEGRGYTVVSTPLDAFLRSGGSACCLTLRLDHRSRHP